MRGRLQSAAVAVFVLGMLACSGSEAAAQPSEFPRLVEYMRVYADASGESHFAAEKSELVPTDYAPPAPEVGVSAATPAFSTVFLGVPAGWFGDFHVAPRRQWIFVLQGEAEIGVSVGETRRFGPGSVFLVEDTHGRGHTTRAVGEAALLLAAVPIGGSHD